MEGVEKCKIMGVGRNNVVLQLSRFSVVTTPMAQGI